MLSGEFEQQSHCCCCFYYCYSRVVHIDIDTQAIDNTFRVLLCRVRC